MTVNLPSVNVAVQPAVLFKKSKTSCIVVLSDVLNVYSLPLLISFMSSKEIAKPLLVNSPNVVEVVATVGVVVPNDIVSFDCALE